MPRHTSYHDYNNKHHNQHDKHCAADNDNYDYGHWHYNHHDLD